MRFGLRVGLFGHRVVPLVIVVPDSVRLRYPDT
jgi:hypothetical protein